MTEVRGGSPTSGSPSTANPEWDAHCGKRDGDPRLPHQLLCQELLHQHPLQSLLPTLCPSKTLEVVGNHIHEQLGRHQLRLADESLQQVTVYCAVALLRQASGHELRQFASDDITPPLAVVARDIYAELPTLTSPGQGDRLSRHPDPGSPHCRDAPAQPGHGGRERTADYAPAGLHPPPLPYDLRGDPQLRADLQTISAPCCCGSNTRLAATIPGGPHQAVLPLAYDITLAAISEWIRQTLPVDPPRIGYLVIHIGVGLERHYDIGYTRRPRRCCCAMRATPPSGCWKHASGGNTPTAADHAGVGAGL